MLSEESVFESPWVRLRSARVRTPSKREIDCHIVRVPLEGAGAVLVNSDGRVLLIYRHRFIVDGWGWELPAGRVDEGEDPEYAARREVLEETGWNVGALSHLVTFHTSPGLSDQVSHIFIGRDAVPAAGDIDPDEAAEIRWFSKPELFNLIDKGEITDSFTLCGLLLFAARGL